MTERNDYIVAIDLGSSNVTIVVGSVNPEGGLTIIDKEIRPSLGVSRGEIKNLEQVAQSIKEAVEELESRVGFKITEAYSGISGFHLQCVKHPYYVYVSGVDGEICEDDVRRLNESMKSVQAPDGHKILHITPQHYVVNGEEAVDNPVGMFGKTLESTFNLIIGDSSITSRVEKALSKVGITLKGLFINSLVAAEAVALPDEKEMGVAIVDIGAGVTDVCIYYDKIVRYMGVVPMGAEAINRDIRAYGILERHVEELKVTFGCAVPDNVDKEKNIKVPGRTPRDPKTISFLNLSNIIEARLKDIADYVLAEIKNAGYEGKLGAGIVLTGGCANLKDIDVMMEKYTGLDVRIAQPTIMIDEESREIVDDCRLATVVGIMVNGAKEGGCEIGGVVAPKRQAQPVNSTAASESAKHKVGATESANHSAKTHVEPKEEVDERRLDSEVDDREEEVVETPKSRKKKANDKNGGMMDWFKKKMDDLFKYEDEIIDDNKY